MSSRVCDKPMPSGVSEANDDQNAELKSIGCFDSQPETEAPVAATDEEPRHLSPNHLENADTDICSKSQTVFSATAEQMEIVENVSERGEAPNSPNPDSKENMEELHSDETDSSAGGAAQHQMPDECQENYACEPIASTGSRVSETGSSFIAAESHVNKLQSFVDSLADRSDLRRLRDPPRSPSSSSRGVQQRLKSMPMKMLDDFCSFYPSVRHMQPSYFPQYSAISPQKMKPASATGFNATEQPLDLSTKRTPPAFPADKPRRSETVDPGAASALGGQFRAFEKLQMENLHPMLSYRPDKDGWKLSTEFDPKVLFPSSFFTRDSEKNSRNRFGGEGRNKGENWKNPFQELRVDVSSPSGEVPYATRPGESSRKKRRSSNPQQSGHDRTSKKKSGDFNGVLSIDKRNHRPRSDDAPARQSPARHGTKPCDPGTIEGQDADVAKPDGVSDLTSMRCNCGMPFDSLYQLAVHIEQSGHVPDILRAESLSDLPKLVRGQDVWISQGRQQEEMILRCVQCRTSFRSLPELTVHMIRTKHYVNIVGSEGQGRQTDDGDQPGRADGKRVETDKKNKLTDCQPENQPIRKTADLLTDPLKQETPDLSTPIQNGGSTEPSDVRDNEEPVPVTIKRSGSSSSIEDTAKFLSLAEGSSLYNNGNHLKALQEMIPIDRQTDPGVRQDVHVDGSRFSHRGSPDKVKPLDFPKNTHSFAAQLQSKISTVTSYQACNGVSKKSRRVRPFDEPGEHPKLADLDPNRHSKELARSSGNGDFDKLSDSLPIGNAQGQQFANSCSSSSSSKTSDCQTETSVPRTFLPCSGPSRNNPEERDRRNKRTMKNEPENGKDETSTKKRRTDSSASSRKTRVSEHRHKHVEKPSSPDVRKEKDTSTDLPRRIPTDPEKPDDKPTETSSDDMDYRFQLVSPPPQPVDSSATLLAIKTFVDKIFSNQGPLSGARSLGSGIVSEQFSQRCFSTTSGVEFPSARHKATKHSPSTDSSYLGGSKSTVMNRGTGTPDFVRRFYLGSNRNFDATSDSVAPDSSSSASACSSSEGLLSEEPHYARCGSLEHTSDKQDSLRIKLEPEDSSLTREVNGKLHREKDLACRHPARPTKSGSAIGELPDTSPKEGVTVVKSEALVDSADDPNPSDPVETQGREFDGREESPIKHLIEDFESRNSSPPQGPAALTGAFSEHELDRPGENIRRPPSKPIPHWGSNRNRSFEQVC